MIHGRRCHISELAYGNPPMGEKRVLVVGVPEATVGMDQGRRAIGRPRASAASSKWRASGTFTIGIRRQRAQSGELIRTSPRASGDLFSAGGPLSRSARPAAPDLVNDEGRPFRILAEDVSTLERV